MKKNRSVWHRLVLLIMIFYVHILHASIQNNNGGTVKGKVVDSQQAPIFSVTVSLVGTTKGDYTNEGGEFVLKNIEPGKHQVNISGVGLVSKTISITIHSNETVDLKTIVMEDQIELSEVVVVGKTEARKQQEQAFALSVLDMKKVQNLSTPLNKILNQVSSVRVREEGGTGSGFNLSLNGFSGNQVKFFLDGISMDHFGTSFNLSTISANMAERIEVYKGVLPIHLGTDALGGAIHIISRQDANYLDASYSIGSFNTHKIAVNGAFRDVKTGCTFRANTFFNYSDNNYKVWVPIVDLQTNKRQPEEWRRRFNDGYVSGGIRLETGITQKSYADYLLAGIIFSKNNKDVQTGATMDAVYGKVKAKSESIIPSIRYKKDDLFTEGLSLTAHGTYALVNAYNIDTAARVYNWLGEWVHSSEIGEKMHTDSRILNREWLANLNLAYTLNLHQSLTLNHSLSSLNRKIHDKADPENESNKIPQKLTKHITGLGWMFKYDQWNAQVFGKMYHQNSSTYKRIDEYTENARLEKIRENKQYFGYGAAFTYYLLPQLQAKLSYEQAYRLPESTEMFGDGLIQQRNPDLKPENSNNLNMGFMFDKNIRKHRIGLETNLIYRNTKDFIRKGVSLTTDPTTGYENVGQVLTRGIEGSFKYTWNDCFHAGANLTYQHIIDNQPYVENSGSFIGEGITENITYKERLPNIPYFFGTADAGIQFRDVGYKNTQLTMDYIFNYTKEYFLSFPGLGAKASKKIIPQQVSHDLMIGYTMQNGRYSLMFECTNLSDAKLYDNYRLQKPGRAFHVRFRYFLK